MPPPPPQVWPTLRARDAHGLIRFLVDAFGCDDTDALHERAKAAGAELVMEPHDQPYGSRDFMARDPEGNCWSLGTYRGE